ncbi:MAG: DUF2786 domain-containing protein, partial [Steroidobacteraceae bacterium]
LAKAESTTFDAEAEALTAKAQELMARHRIDRAVLEHDFHAPRTSPVGRRLAVDDPYAEAKALMLGKIAAANGCHSVWSKGLGFSTAFGFADELDAVEELFTSLLVQAAVALRRAGSKFDRDGRSRTTRFRLGSGLITQQCSSGLSVPPAIQRRRSVRLRACAASKRAGSSERSSTSRRRTGSGSSQRQSG